MDTLPVEQRRVVVLRFVEQKSIKEVAQEIGKTEGAVKQLQFRALSSLRTRLEVPMPKRSLNPGNDDTKKIEQAKPRRGNDAYTGRWQASRCGCDLRAAAANRRRFARSFHAKISRHA